MQSKTLNKRELEIHIKRCLKKGVKFNFLGLVENRDLSQEVENLFKFTTPSGYSGFDWVKGNDKLKDLIEVIKLKTVVL